MSWLDGAYVAVCVIVVVAAYAIGVGRGRTLGRRERCGRHSHAERVAAGRTEAPRHDGPAARISDVDFRHTRIETGSTVDGGDEW